MPCSLPLLRLDRYDRRLEKFYVEIEDGGHVLNREQDIENTEQREAVIYIY